MRKEWDLSQAPPSELLYLAAAATNTIETILASQEALVEINQQIAAARTERTWRGDCKLKIKPGYLSEINNLM